VCVCVWNERLGGEKGQQDARVGTERETRPQIYVHTSIIRTEHALGERDEEEDGVGRVQQDRDLFRALTSCIHV
jgi:hypothetical protein